MNFDKENAIADVASFFDKWQPTPSAYKESKPTLKNKLLWALQHSDLSKSIELIKTLFDEIKTMDIAEQRQAIHDIHMLHTQLLEAVSDEELLKDISESVGSSNYQAVPELTDTAPSKWIEEQAGLSEDKPSPLRKSTFYKLPPDIAKSFQEAAMATNKIFVLSSGLETVPRVLPEYDGTTAHGLNMATDVSYRKKIQEVKQQLFDEFDKVFKERLKLLDAYYPVTNTAEVSQSKKEVTTEDGTVNVDILGNIQDIASPSNDVLKPEE